MQGWTADRPNEALRDEMDSCIYFPHFYLTNDTVLRHQYLYLPSLCRIHTSSRPPRDSKELKRFLSELSQFGFLHQWFPEEARPETGRRFLQVVEHGFRDHLPEYIRLLGKYEKERTSAKTFHLCQVNQWPEAAQRLADLGIAKIDRYHEWCFSTRRMVMTLTTCLAIERQAALQIPRCTDNPEYDELAMLIEGLPPGKDTGRTVWRAVLEFPYFIPQNLGDLSLDRLQTLREEIASYTRFYQEALPESARQLGQADSPAAREAAFHALAGRLNETAAGIQDRLKVFNVLPRRVYGQYRWYISPGGPLESVSVESAAPVRDVSWLLQPWPVSPEEVESITRYPGCYVWSLAAPAQNTGGLGKAVSGWLKQLWPARG